MRPVVQCSRWSRMQSEELWVNLIKASGPGRGHLRKRLRTKSPSLRRFFSGAEVESPWEEIVCKWERVRRNQREVSRRMCVEGVSRRVRLCGDKNRR